MWQVHHLFGCTEWDNAGPGSDLSQRLCGICGLGDGRIIEQGTYQDLMNEIMARYAVY